jgi:hypothetical protein
MSSIIHSIISFFCPFDYPPSPNKKKKRKRKRKREKRVVCAFGALRRSPHTVQFRSPYVVQGLFNPMHCRYMYVPVWCGHCLSIRDCMSRFSVRSCAANTSRANPSVPASKPRRCGGLRVGHKRRRRSRVDEVPRSVGNWHSVVIFYFFIFFIVLS